MNDGFPSPMGIFFVSILDGKMERVHEWVSAPYGDLFYFYMKNIYRKALDEEFPSPLGIFFISILSYGNLTGYRENLHFAVQKVFSGKIRGFEAFNVL